jgi:hypothetical protein
LQRLVEEGGFPRTGGLGREPGGHGCDAQLYHWRLVPANATSGAARAPLVGISIARFSRAHPSDYASSSIPFSASSWQSMQ